MRDDFHLMIAALWESLSLPPPARSPHKVATLAIDDFTIDLREAPDSRRMLISGTAGRLAKDGRLRAAQIKRLLRAGPALLPGNRAGVVLADQARPDARVDVVGVHPYQGRDAAALGEVVQDVLQLLEIHGADLHSGSDAGANRGASRPRPAATPSEDMIFRP